MRSLFNTQLSLSICIHFSFISLTISAFSLFHSLNLMSSLSALTSYHTSSSAFVVQLYFGAPLLLGCPVVSVLYIHGSSSLLNVTLCLSHANRDYPSDHMWILLERFLSSTVKSVVTFFSSFDTLLSSFPLAIVDIVQPFVHYYQLSNE